MDKLITVIVPALNEEKNIIALLNSLKNQTYTETNFEVLVIDDLLGLNQEFKPKFVTNYENIAEKIAVAVNNFSCDVKSKKFPLVTIYLWSLAIFFIIIFLSITLNSS